MKWSHNHIYTMREAPADAEIASHQLLVRGGYIKKLAPGIFSLQNLALRSLHKIQNIIRRELNKRACTEILMPMVQPAELWQESGRINIDGLLKFKNRSDQMFCLGPTHEEVVTDIVRKDVKSYRDLPRNLYQIQTKYRDEIRPRFGLLRGREFIMKDAYSFDVDVEAAHKSYRLMYEAYDAIISSMGLEYRVVEADSGDIGGDMSNEFQVLASAGEDQIVYCDTCKFAANIEVAPCDGRGAVSTESPKPLEEFDTPNLKTIADLAKVLKVKERTLVKTLFYQGPNGPVALLLRGSDEAHPIKIKKVLGMKELPLFLTEEEVRKVSGAGPGSCGPVGLKIPIYIDKAIENYVNFVTGANKDDKHFRNVNRGRDFTATDIVDIRMAVEGDLCAKCHKGRYLLTRGIEVGHIFYLGTKYSKTLGANYLNADQKSIPIEMGCYGLGVTRTLQASIEQNHDKDGIIWPIPIAPFEVHICLLDTDDKKSCEIADSISQGLEKHGYEALIDDRSERPGVKFKDADLLGMPLRITVGKRGIEANEIEVTVRKDKSMTKVSVEKTLEHLLAYLKEHSQK